MKHYNALSNQTTRRILPIACATALAVAFAVSLPAHAGQVTPPPVPPELKVDAGNHAFLVGHAIGTQNYVCAPSATGVAYVLFTPEATLYNDDGDQLITHFFSPNPDPRDPNISPAVVADGAIRATTQVQRLSTTGGNAPGPGHGCDSPSDVGHTAFVDYTADYFFYTNQ